MRNLIVFVGMVLFFASCGARSGNARQVEISACLEGVVINGVRWATRNVDMAGTFAETPESFGMFFQWNRRKGWNATDREVEDWDNSIPLSDIWEEKNGPCPTGWRLPTRKEIENLLDVGYTWIVRNGVNGVLFGTVSNQIFLPAAGWRHFNHGALYHQGYVGVFGSSSSQVGSNPIDIINLHFTFDFLSNVINVHRTHGFNIRCVAK